MVHKDCFAYKNRNGQDCCTALREMKCDGCVFYKPAKTAGSKPKRKSGESSTLGRPSNISDKTKDEIANDKPAQIYATEQGVVIFDRKLINIAATDNSVENVAYNDELPMLTVWDGFLKAIIMPMRCLSERELIMLERFVSQAKLARENKMLLPDEPEQIGIDDYPFEG